MSKRPHGLIERVKTALGSDKVASTKQRLEEQRSLIEQRRSEREQADEAVTAAQAARLANMEADDATLDSLDAAIKAAEVGVLRTADRLAVAERRLAEAEDSAKAAAAEAAESAIAQIIETESVGLVERYAEICRSVMAMLQDIARVDQNISSIAAEGGIATPSSVEVAGRLRMWAAHEETVSSKIVTLWTDRTGAIVAPQPSPDDVKKDGVGYYLEAPADVVNMGRLWNTSNQLEIQKRRFRKVVVLERDPTASYIESWGSKLVLPGLGAGHSSIFEGGGSNAAAVELAIERIEKQLQELTNKASPRRQVERLTPVSDTDADA